MPEARAAAPGRAPACSPAEAGADDERARLFVALELPESARSALAEWRDAPLSRVSGLRPVRPEDLHVTLCFLGTRPAAEIEQIGAACGVVAGEPPVESAFGGAGVAAAPRPRVLAVSLSDPEGALAGLQATLSAALVAGGWYAPESRPFLAHVTVARVARDARIRAVELPAFERLGRFSARASRCIARG